jgi:hypothetical protein
VEVEQEVAVENPEVQIAVEEPVAAGESIEEQLEEEQAAADGDEGEGEEDEAWGI